MSRFIRREDLPKQEKRKFIKQKIPFDINENFIDNVYEMPLQLDSSSRNFSFKDDLPEIESLQNPNIVDSIEFNGIKNSKLQLNDKFDNQNDPIFDLDDSSDVVYSDTKNKSNNLSKVTTKIKNRKLGNTSSTSRYKI